MGFWQYVSLNQDLIISLFLDHIKLTSISVGLAILIGVPVGIFISYSRRAGKPILSLANIIQAVPSMALLGFMIPFFGIGTLPAVVAVVLYSLLPIIKNTYTGIESINYETTEAARGIGLTKAQVLTKIQIPMALPVIMAGVRIAAVTAVGLMTIAAFIGAGGLGFLVFSGIRTVNNSQILAGAIPACILALLVDYVIGLAERLFTPISLQKGSMAKKIKNRVYQKTILGFTAALLVIGFTINLFNTTATQERTIVIGTKDFTEQQILGNMVADLIETHTDIYVNRKINLGGTQVCFTALKSNDIDMYIEYSGTIYTDMLKHPPVSDMELVYNTGKKELKEKFNIETLKQFNFNNTYAMAVTQDMAAKYNLKTVSDLARVAGNMTSGTVFEFLNRADGLPGLEKKYGFKMGKSVALDGSPRYTALINGEVDVIDAFTTDGLLKKFDLMVLEDDKKFFPPYFAMPIVRAETLSKYPEIVPLLEKLGAALSNSIMMELNYRVDELEETPSAVAKDFLISKGLI